MGNIKNAADSAIIVFGFFILALAVNGLGADVFHGTLFSPVGIIICLLLAFMETTYNRF